MYYDLEITATAVSTPTVGERNVLNKVASFTVECSASVNGTAPLVNGADNGRFVTEKLNIGDYHKFEGKLIEIHFYYYECVIHNTPDSINKYVLFNILAICVKEIQLGIYLSTNDT